MPRNLYATEYNLIYTPHGKRESEVILTEETRAEAAQTLKAYRENDTTGHFQIKTARVIVGTEPTKKEQAQAERVTMIEELKADLQKYNSTIYTVTLSEGYNRNGNWTTRARYWIIGHTAEGEHVKLHVTHKIATLFHGRYKNFKATTQGHTSECIRELSNLLQIPIYHHELNP
jgi:hypothetical protein